MQDKVGRSELAEWLACDPRSISNYLADGHVKRAGRAQYLLKESVRGVVTHLRAGAAGLGSRDAGLDLATERARLAKEQADGHAIKNAAARQELVPAADVERAWGGVCANVRSRMLAVTSFLPSDLPHLTRHDLDVIDRAIRDALTELAEEKGTA